MIGKFWEGVGGKLADRWAAVTAPALVFWLGGLLAWTVHHGGMDHISTLTNWLDRQGASTDLVVVLAALVAVAASGLIVVRLTTPALRLLEGYWPTWMDWPRHRLLKRMGQRAADDVETWQRLAPRALEHRSDATAAELAKFARVDQRIRRRPAAANRLMPTRIGNILRAAETWPYEKYGLDAVAIWPRLWLVLPDATRQELIGARAALDSTVAAAIWGLLFCAFAVWTPLAIPVGLLVALTAVAFWAPTRAEVFGDLIESAYDLHRTALYQQLRWPAPLNPQQERGEGERLTSYLWRGSDEPNPTLDPN